MKCHPHDASTREIGQRVVAIRTHPGTAGRDVDGMKRGVKKPKIPVRGGIPGSSVY
jgi:hypothetical protein